MSFVDHSNVTRCSLHLPLYNASQACELVRTTFTCGLFVHFVNHLQIAFCSFHLPFVSVYALISFLLLLAIFGMSYTLAEYFFMPNFVTLMDIFPLTKFAFSYLFFGISFFVPYYLSIWRSCVDKVEHLSAVQFSRMTGDLMRHFVTGVMVLCIRGYRVDGVNIWSSLVFILLGFGYLIAVTSKQYDVHENTHQDIYLLKFRVIIFLFVFSMVSVVVFVVSHTNFWRLNPPKDYAPEDYSNLESDAEVLGRYSKRRQLKRCKIWWRTVNGFRNTKGAQSCLGILLIPFYFLAAHLIPVLAVDRPLCGWNKYVNCFSLVIFPFLCMPLGIGPEAWLLLVVICWLSSVLVFMSTHSLRQPDYVWPYALLGLSLSSLALRYLIQEVENLTWQFVSFRFDVMPDLVALMCFGLGDIFCEVIILWHLIQRKFFDAAFGVVMSMVTYGILLALPLLLWHGCYNSNTHIIVTGPTETCIQFLFLMFGSSLFHVSMSGYEFRMSLFLYLLAVTVVYMTFQWMTYHFWVHSFATLHNV
ncbi:uncharacterized protein LOC117583971 [Drosophila guanche]|uniref:Sodium/potassium/calcium exchanger 6, mitochondrial n=1 Tax=Drosophila guanche TaxID=7266 RepID=A0A3B0JIM1_DROGU|nr:uncharacterized protein LOC117583971 [Drosophila guanche]SPP82217.1 Hypothetical predicted protein [Drosophila guanche]